MRRCALVKQGETCREQGRGKSDQLPARGERSGNDEARMKLVRRLVIVNRIGVGEQRSLETTKKAR
jgi:hypothetical protein